MTEETRFSTSEFYAWFTKVEVLASFSLVRPDDTFDVALVAEPGDATAIATLNSMKTRLTACVFIESDGAGGALLAALEKDGIAAANVSISSCRVGDPRSLLNDGCISAVNELARRFGGQIGQSTREFTEKMVRTRETKIRSSQIRKEAAFDRMSDMSD